MTALDHDSRRVLAHRSATSPAFWGEVDDATGSDDAGAVQVVVDPAARVRSVTIIDPTLVRTAAALEARVLEAFRAADTARAVAVQLGRGLEEPPSTPEAMVAALRPRVRRPTGAIRHARMVADSGGGEPAAPTAPPRVFDGSSDNGMVTVRTAVTGDPVAVLVDATWLSAATAGSLQSALLQSFHRSFAGYADSLTHPGGTP